MRKILFGALTILAVVFVGYLIYFSTTHTSFLEILNFLNPPSQGPDTLAPEEPLELVPQEIIINGQTRTLRVPKGYKIEVFADGFSKARFMAFDPATGDLYLTESDKGRVWNVTKRQIVAEGLDFPHGIAFHPPEADKPYLYISDQGSVHRLDVLNRDSVYRFEPRDIATIINSLPRGGNHVSSTIAFGPDGKLHVSRGSSCNVCEDDPRRAVVLRFNADGTGEEIFARGLRNSVGIIFHPVTGELWGTDNGRDFLGEDLPPEEINIVKVGKHYGWPYCYGQNISDPDFGSKDTCDGKTAPVVEMQAHSAPLGLRFDDEGRYLYVAFHGSWNRTVPTGYKVIRISVGPNGEDPKISDYITGWLPEGETKAWGRPVDVIFPPEAAGAMYISDDLAGVIYRLSKF